MENLKVLSNKLEEFVPSDILSFEESDDNLETNLLEYISWGRSDLGTLFSNASVDHDITPITFQGSRKIIQFSSKGKNLHAKQRKFYTPNFKKINKFTK